MKKNGLRRPSTRRLVQLYAALLYNANLKGFVEGDIYQGGTKALCVPGLNCYSCPAAVGACPLGALQNAIAASAKRPAFYVIGILLLFGMSLGRTICGWLCPFGLIQELLHRLPGPKLKKGKITRRLSWLKYALLAVLVVVLPLWSAFRSLPLPAFCKYICPAGTLEGAAALLLHPANAALRGMLGGLFLNKLILLALILLACVFLYRAFCRFLCPLGALYGLMTRLALVGIKLDRARCTDCGTCLRVCPMDIRRVGDRECIACGKCVSRCPEQAISLRAGRIRLPDAQNAAGGSQSEKSARKRSLIAWGLALAVLAGALICYNVPFAAGAEPVPATAAPETGSEPGKSLPDFSIQTLGGQVFRLSEHRGQPVVLNLWATWCAPCVKELPAFEAFAAAHPDAAVLAIHSGLITEDVPTWVEASGLGLAFAVDENGETTALLGAGSMLPHTVVLDREGKVLYNAPGSVTAELLEALYRQAS